MRSNSESVSADPSLLERLDYFHLQILLVILLCFGASRDLATPQAAVANESYLLMVAKKGTFARKLPFIYFTLFTLW